MNNLQISKAVAEKRMKKYGVQRAEGEQCFANRVGGLLEDTRVDLCNQYG